MNHIQTDLAIIGAGAAGLSLAAGAVQLGLRVVLIESNEMGGDCLNYGCVPSKTLIAIAKSVYSARNNKYLQLGVESSVIDFAGVMRSVEKVIQTISVHDSQQRFTQLGVYVIRAQARFTGKKELVAGDHCIKAKKIVIATGSTPFIPKIKGLEDVTYFTNETVFKLKALPEHLVIIGGGPIGCEMAQAFAMLGAKVSILEAFVILPKDDPESVAIIRDKLKEVGVKLYEGVQINTVSQGEDDSVKVALHDDKLGKNFTVVGSHLLIAAGRRPSLSSLGLDKAKITYTDRGIKVDRRLRTSNKSVYAMGDVVGGYQFTHVANYHAGIVLKNIVFKIPSKVNNQSIPWVTYTSPEVAHVGATFDPNKLPKSVQVLSMSMSNNDRAQTEQDTVGMIKVWVNRKGKILGVTIVDAHAGDLILPWIMALHKGSKLKIFTDTVIPYPTRSEISKRIASQFYTPKLFSDKVRWLVKMIQKLG